MRKFNISWQITL